MGTLLEMYENLTKQAEEQQVDDERVQVIEKYAQVAQGLLEKEYPNNFTDEDVVKLADALIQHDIGAEESLEKLAELEDAGRVIARAFIAELQDAQSQ